MSWKNLDLDHIRMEFVLIAREAYVSMSEVCRQFCISRKTGYKWLRRYEEEGLAGIRERSRRPHRIKDCLSGETIMQIVETRIKHPFWGPKKIVDIMRINAPVKDSVPSISSIARVLNRLNLTEPKGRGRRKSVPRKKNLSSANMTNEVWTVDFKGWWRLRNGEKCEPLTIRDLYSRYILCIKPMRSKLAAIVQEEFKYIFSRYGLPQKIRTDNGSPFASVFGPQGLSKLSAWWRTLGIELERIRPGHPEENGSHERFHLDIAKEIESNPSETLEKEGKRLERWRYEYNYIRPNEAIGMKRPGEIYTKSRRNLDAIESFCYPEKFIVRKVKKD